MSDPESKKRAQREPVTQDPSKWVASQATRFAGAGPLPGPEAVSLGRRGVLCVKCEHLNETDAERCSQCTSHLYVFCQRCGAKNPRVNSRCEKCQRRLHRSVKDRVKGNDGRSVNLLYVGLTLIGILLAIVVLILVSGFQLPRLW